MDDAGRKPSKRISQSKNEAPTKKAKINGFVEEELKRNVDSEENDTNDVICNEKQDEFNGRSLRALLSSSSGLDALRKFVTICNENKEKDLAAEYLLAGGGILEILRLLEFSDKKNTINAIPIFSAINILLMKYVYISFVFLLILNIFFFLN